tara:strand:- start:7229 stop:7534 length:306 start_codon:yes stop_codon:yes gene_type:complete
LDFALKFLLHFQIDQHANQHNFAHQENRRNKKGDPENLSIEFVIPSKKNHRQNPQSQQAQGICGDHKPTDYMNPNGHSSSVAIFDMGFKQKPLQPDRHLKE